LWSILVDFCFPPDFPSDMKMLVWVVFEGIISLSSSFSVSSLFLYFFVLATANCLATSHVFPVLLHGNNCSDPGSSSALVDICQIRVISSPLLNLGM